MCWLWAAKSFLLSSCDRAIHEMFPFLCCVPCTLVQKKNFHLWKASTHNYYSLYIIYCLSISLFSYSLVERQKWVQTVWSFGVTVAPSSHQHLTCTVSRSCWSRDTSYSFPLEDARWHIFTSEVTAGDNEIGGPFHPHIVSLITVCQLLVWLCMSAH